jgi:hypothetical protein
MLLYGRGSFTLQILHAIRILIAFATCYRLRYRVLSLMSMKSFNYKNS